MDMQRYLDLFLAEAEDRLRATRKEFQELRSGAVPGRLQSLFRHLHSLKGMAATMGFQDMVRLSHALEDLMDRARDPDRPVPLSSEEMDWIESGLDYLRRIVGKVRSDGNGDYRDAAVLAGVIQERLQGEGALPRRDPGQNRSRRPPQAKKEAESLHYRVELALRPLKFRSTSSMVRLVNATGELGRVRGILPPILGAGSRRARGRLAFDLETGLEEEELLSRLGEIQGIRACRVQRSPSPPSPVRSRKSGTRYVRVRSDLLDLLMETSMDLALSQESLAAALPVDADPTLTREVENCRALMREQYSSLIELRLVPFELVANRIHAGVESLVEEVEKAIEFSIEGRMVRLDRSLLESMVDPLLHLVRNAVDHGIEPADDRVRQGKNPTGKIMMKLVRTSGSVKILVEDDGRGLDPERLRKTAVEKGFLTERRARELTAREALRLVTLPAFSTARRISRISGRGVGLDAVREEVESLGGRLEIDSTPGHGTSFILELPQNMAIIQALLVRSSGRLFALPIGTIRKTMDLAALSVSRRRGRTFIQADDWTEPRPAGPVSDLFGGSETGSGTGALPRGIALIPSGEGTVFLADEVIGRKDLLVRPLEPPLRALSRFTGAAILQDGAVALVVDPERISSGRSPR